MSRFGERLRGARQAPGTPPAGLGEALPRPGPRWAEPRRSRGFLLPSSPGLRAALRARGRGREAWGRKAWERTGEPLSPEKKVGALGGKRETSPPDFAAYKVSLGRFVCAPGGALQAGRPCPRAVPLAPLLLPAAGAAPLPPREAPNGYLVNPTGRGLQRLLLPPLLPAPAGWEPGPAGGSALRRRAGRVGVARAVP